MSSELLKDIRNSTGAFKKRIIKTKEFNFKEKTKCEICKKEFNYLKYPTAVCSVECAKKWLKENNKRRK